MKKVFVYGLLATLAITGCQAELEELIPENNEQELNTQEPAKVFTAIVDDDFSGDTKTSLDGSGNVLWKLGNQVSIFAASTVNEQYQVSDDSDGKTAATLNKIPAGGFVAGTDIDNNVAFYPYASTASIAKSGSNYVISDVELPATQTYAAGSFGNGAFPMAAVTSSTEDMNLKFKNVLGGLKLQLKGTATITSITVTGNNDEILYGDAEVTMAYGGVPSISLSDATAKTVTLDCGAGVTLDSETATIFIIALPPMTMTGGFTVVVTDSESKQMEIKTTKSQTIPRSNLLKMPAVTYVGTVKEYEYTISTDAGGGTKASFTGSDFVWNTGDKVFLSDGSNSALCTIAAAYDGLTTAVVKTTQVLTGTVHCIYPGDAVTEDSGTFYVDVPANQGTDGSAYMVYYGSAASSTISLSAQTALIKVHLQSDVDDLASVKITMEGSPIVGRLQINGLGTSVVSGTQTAQVTEDGDNDFYFSVLPGSITNMDIDVCKTDGSYGRKTSSSSWSISAATAYNFSINPATLSFVYPVSPLKFASTGSTSISLTKTGSPDSISLECKLDDGEWTSYTVGNTIDLTDGQEVSFRAGASGNASFSQSSTNYYKFSVTGSGTVSASGNLMSLLNRAGGLIIPNSHCFYRLFLGCGKLTTAPELPATTLTGSCYANMFSNCSGLTTVPELPATILANGCYSGMFTGCTSLTTSPELPATTLAEDCYYYMFSGCTNLATAPELPATTLAVNCYYYMFNGCTSLAAAPELPATTLAEACYECMFHNCTGLNTVPSELPATTLATYCYHSMFSGCASLTTAPELPATILANGCYYMMFSGCTNLTTAPELPATTLVNNCYSYLFYNCTQLNHIKALFTTTPSYSYTNSWVSGVAATGTFVKNSSATWDVTGIDGVPSGWTIETE